MFILIKKLVQDNTLIIVITLRGILNADNAVFQFFFSLFLFFYRKKKKVALCVDHTTKDMDFNPTTRFKT